jgi:hypothetical protein
LPAAAANASPWAMVTKIRRMLPAEAHALQAQGDVPLLPTDASGAWVPNPELLAGTKAAELRRKVG